MIPALSRWRRGLRAERLAAQYLEQRGMKILARNRRHRRGELDLVCREADVLCVVEVRSRGEGSDYVPERSIGPDKLKRLKAGADELRRRYRLGHVPVRIDFLVVDWMTGDPEIRFYPGGIR